ncbi:MAG: lysozyme [Bacteroidales bacterium]|nr:lysozyme [Bacteroidales bacterium]
MAKRLKYLVIHCTATPEGREVSAADIRRWHTSVPPAGRGWKQVGYTDLFHLDGSVERLVKNNEDAQVDPWEITNGAAGYNSISRHVVYVGGVDADNVKEARDTRTPEQREAMKHYVLDFHRKHPSVKIVGHYQLANKACPSFDVPAWLESIGINQ